MGGLIFYTDGFLCVKENLSVKTAGGWISGRLVLVMATMGGQDGLIQGRCAVSG